MVSLRPTINWDFPAPYAHYYRFQRGMSESEGYQHPCGGFTISSIHPKENWDPTQKALLIRRDVLGQELTYCGVFLLTPQISRDHVSTYLLVNFDQLSRNFDGHHSEQILVVVGQMHRCMMSSGSRM
jgi:hypothetical protein